MTPPDFFTPEQFETSIKSLDSSRIKPPMPREYRYLFSRPLVNWDAVSNIAHKTYISIEYGALLGLGGVATSATGDLKWVLLTGLISAIPMMTRDTRHGLMNLKG